MDNPWESPWADEAESPNINTKQVETPRPKTPTRTPNLALQPSTASPWDDIGGDNGDNDFGDWTEMSSEKPATGFGLDGGNDGWNGTITNDQGLGKQKDDGFSMAWNGEIPIEDTISEPNLAPSPLSKAEGIVRLPSPDPWSLEPETIMTPIVHKQVILKDEGSEKDAVPIKTSERDLRSDNVHSDSAIELLPESDDVAFSNTAAQHEKIWKDKTSPEERKVASASDVVVKEEPSTSNENGPPSSRPSSSPSDRSQHDEIFAESPRTSFDEEPKQRPQVSRKVSSKVQELVEHFDTIAKKEDVPVLTSTKTTKHDVDIGDTEKSEDSGFKEEHGVDIESEDDEFGDFGEFEEFEDGQSGNEAAIEQSEIMGTAPKANEGQRPSRGTAKKDNGPITWNPDTSLLGKIYPDLKESTVPERCFIPDNIPHDSFTSTEERKMWYRVSRYGPMRQHNTGDDENYVRVNWKKSKVYDETLKIVARWIEEDRISGRVVLGGGSKAGSIFGWNEKNAKPASISAAFAERKPKKNAVPVPVPAAVDVPREWPKGLVKERSASHGRSSSQVRRKSSVKSITSVEDVKNEKASPLPVANFGWNTDTVAEGPKKASSRPSSSHKKSGSISSISSTTKAPSPKQNRPPRSLHSSTGSVSKIGEFSPQSFFPATKLETILSPSLAKPTLSTINTVQPPPVQPVTQIPDSFDDDDDWGEMISSPATVTTAPVLPPNKLRHKKSQSLLGSVPSMKSKAAATIPENNHRPSVSFDQILSPTYPSSQLSSPVISSSFAPSVQPSASVAPTAPLPQTKTVSDPWASADFSFFDSAPVPVAAVVPKPKLAPNGNMKAKALPKPSPLKASSLAAAPVGASPSPITSNARRSKEEMEQDRIVQGILKTLPDLSYMFNR